MRTGGLNDCTENTHTHTCHDHGNIVEKKKMNSFADKVTHGMTTFTTCKEKKVYSRVILVDVHVIMFCRKIDELIQEN